MITSNDCRHCRTCRVNLLFIWLGKYCFSKHLYCSHITAHVIVNCKWCIDVRSSPETLGPTTSKPCFVARKYVPIPASIKSFSSVGFQTLVYRYVISTYILTLACFAVNNNVTVILCKNSVFTTPNYDELQ